MSCDHGSLLRPAADEARRRAAGDLGRRSGGPAACVLGAVALLFVATACGRAHGGVDRLVDGRTVRGRSVAEEAYALYTRAAYLEVSGEVDQALTAYVRVLDFDPQAVEAWTRIGALSCPGDPERAERAFASAEALDGAFEPLWRARAECALAHGQAQAARAAALRALALDPDRGETSLLLVRSYEAAGDVESARRWLNGLVLRDAVSPAAWRAALAFAERHGDVALARRARSSLARLRPDVAGPERASVARAAVDGALLADDLAAARVLATSGRVDPAEVALRAAALGRARIAREQAELVLAADPRSSDAWIAALVAADLTQDIAGLREVLDALDAEPLEPSPLGARLLLELLSRMVGPEAARAWQDARGPLPAPEDELEARVAARSGT